MSAAPRPYSIRRRLLLGLLVSTAVFGTLAMMDTLREAVRMANLLSDRVLAGSALVISERASLDDNGQITIDVPYGALEMLSSAAQDRVFSRVDGPNGQIVTGYPDLPTAPAQQDGPPVFADADYKGTAVRLTSFARAVSTGIDEMPFVVTIAETTNARAELTRSILFSSALRLLLMMFWGLADRDDAVTVSLRPLRQLSGAIALRSPDDLSPVDTGVPSEVRGLVSTINLFMTRLGSALEGLRNFTGNAAHQLRTPMAVVRTQLALSARATTLSEAQAAAAKGDLALARAEHVLGQLLLLARVDTATQNEAQLIDLVSFAQEAVAEQIPAAAAAGVDLGFEGDGPIHLRFDPLLLNEAVQNLISNAILHGGTGTEVTLRVTQSADFVALEVEDNGPGIAPHDRAAVLSRFSRGATPAVGYGLGLPVADEIARLFGGALHLQIGAGGRGLRAVLQFPKTPAEPV